MVSRNDLRVVSRNVAQPPRQPRARLIVSSAIRRIARRLAAPACAGRTCATPP